MTHLVCLFACTAGHFVRLFMQGWLAAPLTSFICPVLLFALSRGTPILAEGIAVARSVCFWLLGFFLGKLKSVRFAFLATGLDAVQRLEQKKPGWRGL